jgi:hypothetical protein
MGLKQVGDFHSSAAENQTDDTRDKVAHIHDLCFVKKPLSLTTSQSHKLRWQN